jgi:tripartite-type tricarboxylate transporter receptor subunit TctC
MINLRRSILAGVVASLTLLAIGPTEAVAQAFPTRPIRLIVPLPAGGVTDVMARTIAAEMSNQLGQQVIVENRTGANGAIAGDAVAKGGPDGYTVGFFPNTTVVLLPLLGKVPQAVADLRPVSRLYDLDLVVVARSDFPASSLAQLIAMAKAQPGKISYGSTGVGGPLHLGWELLKAQGGFDMTHVPYRGGSDQLTALLGGQIDTASVGTYDAGVWIKQGKVKVIASMAARRNPVFPEVPTVSESGFPGVVANSWAALFVPPGTPLSVTERLSQAALAALRTPAVRERLVSNGLTPLGEERSEEISASMASESGKWLKIIKQLGPANLN